MLTNYNQKRGGRAVTKGPSQSSQRRATGGGRRRRRRRSGRGRRRAQNKQTPRDRSMSGWGDPPVDSSNFTLAATPASVSGTLPQIYFRGGLTAPRHKRWGPGERFIGCCLVGRVETGEGQYGILDPVIARYGAGNFIDLIYYYQRAMGFAAAGDQLTFAVHPGILPRLTTECFNWGQYVFRNLTAHYIPKTSSSIADGYISVFSKDIQGCLDTTTGSFNNWAFNSGDLRGGAFWQGFKHSIDDMTTDQTWSTMVPCVDPGTLTTSVMQNANVLADVAGDYYQFCHTFFSGGDNISFQAHVGWLYYEFIIDFYQQRQSSSLALVDVTLPDANTTSLSSSSSSGSTSQVSHPSGLLRNIGHKLNFGLPPSSKKSYAQILKEPSIIPPDLKSDSKLDSTDDLKTIGRRTAASKEVRSWPKKVLNGCETLHFDGTGKLIRPELSRELSTTSSGASQKP